MGTLIRRLVWLIVIAVLCYAAYVAYLRWWDNGFVERARETVATFVAGTLEKAKTTVGMQVEEKANQVANTVVSEATGVATRYVKAKASEALSAIGAKIVETAGSLIGTSTSDHPWRETASTPFRCAYQGRPWSGCPWAPADPYGYARFRRWRCRCPSPS